jgi:hypothetical protein
MIDDRDTKARELAIATVRGRGRAEAERIDQEIAERGFMSAGRSATYRCQYDALRLKPWQSPPCWIDRNEIDAIIARGDDGVLGDYAAAKLLRRMLAANVSQFHPDPERALREVAKKPAA